MPHGSGRILAINPGSTSTKFGVYTKDGAEWEHTIRHGDEELARFHGKPMLARLDYRAGLVEKALTEAGYTAQIFAAPAHPYTRRLMASLPQIPPRPEDVLAKGQVAR